MISSTFSKSHHPYRNRLGNMYNTMFLIEINSNLDNLVGKLLRTEEHESNKSY